MFLAGKDQGVSRYFRYTTDQLFWLAALPGVSGATLRIFYSFTVPIFGGRLWTTLATWSLMIPAVGVGYAVQNPATPYWIFLVLALLCGFGGGNFASSMANISFFFPKAEKGNALALNAGLGNLGVSVVQFVIPLVITAGVFGWLGGDPQNAAEASGTTRLWLQNAGFIWVPFIAASAFACWFGMNDIASAKASFAEQAVIFERKHNWIMCWLYTGTFGSFIGYSAGFPLLAKTQFPAVDALPFVFLGPLVGALSRSATGWVSDKWGGGRVTFWVFILMMIDAVFPAASEVVMVYAGAIASGAIASSTSSRRPSSISSSAAAPAGIIGKHCSAGSTRQSMTTVRFSASASRNAGSSSASVSTSMPTPPYASASLT